MTSFSIVQYRTTVRRYVDHAAGFVFVNNRQDPFDLVYRMNAVHVRIVDVVWQFLLIYQGPICILPEKENKSK